MSSRLQHKSRVASVLWIALFCSPAIAGHEYVQVSPEEAASHLVKKVAAEYPAFAKAAGVEGVVRITAQIDQRGRVRTVYDGRGAGLLYEAARRAVEQYSYRPFEQQGKLVDVQTTVVVRFELAGRAHATPPPPPELTPGLFTVTDGGGPHTRISEALRKWLIADWQKSFDELFCVADASTPAPGEAKDMGKLLDESTIVELPTEKSLAHIYFIAINRRCMCGATGNCPIRLVEEDARGIHRMGDTMGWGFYAHLRAGAQTPDIFIPSHLSASRIGIAGFSKAGGLWGRLYCGEITADGASLPEEDKLRVCR